MDCVSEIQSLRKNSFQIEETRQGIAEEVVELLVKEKFVLIGTSSPSIDDEKSHRLS